MSGPMSVAGDRCPGTSGQIIPGRRGHHRGQTAPRGGQPRKPAQQPRPQDVHQNQHRKRHAHAGPQSQYWKASTKDTGDASAVRPHGCDWIADRRPDGRPQQPVSAGQPGPCPGCRVRRTLATPGMNSGRRTLVTRRALPSGPPGPLYSAAAMDGGMKG